MKLEVLECNEVRVKAYPVRCNSEGNRIVAAFASRVEADAYVVWREYRAQVNAECDAFSADDKKPTV